MRQFVAYGNYVTIGCDADGWWADINGQVQTYETEPAAVMAALDWCQANALSEITGLLDDPALPGNADAR